MNHCWIKEKVKGNSLGIEERWVCTRCRHGTGGVQPHDEGPMAMSLSLFEVPENCDDSLVKMVMEK
jgi:hypothetical protein